MIDAGLPWLGRLAWPAVDAQLAWVHSAITIWCCAGCTAGCMQSLAHNTIPTRAWPVRPSDHPPGAELVRSRPLGVRSAMPVPSPLPVSICRAQQAQHAGHVTKQAACAAQGHAAANQPVCKPLARHQTYLSPPLAACALHMFTSTNVSAMFFAPCSPLASCSMR